MGYDHGTTAALLAGAGLGFVVAAQVGPIWLLCARSTLRHGAGVGLAIGAGAAVVDTLYATAGSAGAAGLLAADAPRLAFGLLGAAVLLLLGLRTIWHALRVRHGAEHPDEVSNPRRAFATGLGATASNPATIASWAAIFTAASAARLTTSAVTTGALLLGVALGSLGWFAVLAGGLALVRHRVGDRALLLADTASGAGIAGFGVLLGWRALRDG